jgi:acetyl esterase/lipase
MLYCGPYNTKTVNLEGDFGGFLKTVLWSYSGTKDFMTDSNFATANIINYINKDFPPAFISVGNNDPLQSNSYELAAVLKKKGVMTKTVFFEKNYEPKLSHEYQFHLELEAAQKVLAESVLFLSEATK